MIVRRWKVQLVGCAVLLAGFLAVTVASAAPRPTLTVTVVGEGRVTSVPRGIHCPDVCRASYPTNSRVRLVPRPATGWRLKTWSGGCQGTKQCVTKLVNPTRVRATFAKIPPPIVPAKVVLQKSGFSVSPGDSTTAVGLGLVLHLAR